MSARSARRPVPALVFLLALAILAVVVWVRVADRDSAASDGGATSCASAPQLPASAAVTVTVLNGTDKQGLAGTVLDGFAGVGFAKGNVGNTETPFDGVGTITYGPNGALSALLVSYYLPGATFATDTREDTGVTVTVGAGFTALADPAAAAAAQASARVSQTPAAPPSGEVTPGATGSTPAPAATCTTTPPAPTPTGTPAA